MIELDPNFWIAYNNRNVSSACKKSINRAISLYKKAIKINPNFAKAYNSMGSDIKEIKKYEEAEKVLKQVIKLYPEFTKLIIILVGFLASLVIIPIQFIIKK